mmetsp:Transcript_2848/g.7104  ORF Transcript_2848/g.7104 Transcript_2848/m.7104 type:complete len:255 (+) Transcript_2848:439-1203(+)
MVAPPRPDERTIMSRLLTRFFSTATSLGGSCHTSTTFSQPPVAVTQNLCDSPVSMGTWSTTCRLQRASLSGRDTPTFTRPKPCRTEGGDSSGTPFRSGSSLGVVPDMPVAPAISTAFTSAPLGVYLCTFTRAPLGYIPSMKYCRTSSAAPPTRGVAMEVPCSTEERHCPGSAPAPADTVSPGATRSGLMRPSGVGPMEEKGARLEKRSRGSCWCWIHRSRVRPASRARYMGRAPLRGMEAAGIMMLDTELPSPE